MRFAPFLMVGVTASAALLGSAMLAAEDRALFEPQHATAMLDVVDQVGAAWDAPEPRARATSLELRQGDRPHAERR